MSPAELVKIGEDENVLLSELETMLRNYIKSSLEAITTEWWKQRLPEDVRIGAEERWKKELQKGNLLEYLNWGDYEKIFFKNDNWNDIFTEDTDTVADVLSKITPAGERTVIYTLSARADPTGVMIDSSGNYILVEHQANILSKITPTGVRTVIYTFSGEGPLSVKMDSSGNYIVLEYDADTLSKITPTGERLVIYAFTTNTRPQVLAIDSSGNYIVTEFNTNVLSKITPAGERTVIYNFPGNTGPNGIIISTSKAPQLLFADITQNGLTVTWTQSTDPFFAGYQIYQSSTQGDLGTLIGTNTDIADTSLAVTGLSPGTTYYFTVRVLGASGAYVESVQQSGMTAKAFWQQDWFPSAVFWLVLIAVAAIVIYVLGTRYRKRAQVT